MKKGIILNIIPFVAWIILFFCQLGDVLTSGGFVTVELNLLFTVPIVLSVINLLVAKDETDFLQLNFTLAAANIVGFLMQSSLYSAFISNDTKNDTVTGTFLIGLIIYIAVITLIGFLIKKLSRKSKHKNETKEDNY